MQSKALGFDRSSSSISPSRRRPGFLSDLKDELLRSPFVPFVSGTSQIPTNISANSWAPSGKARTREPRSVGITQADFDYPETLGAEMAAGRTFRREFGTDRGGAFLVNEETARLMGLRPQDAVARSSGSRRRGAHRRVMKNYHYKPVDNPLEPMAVLVVPQAVRFAIARLAGGDVPAALKQVEAAWNKVNPRLRSTTGSSTTISTRATRPTGRWVDPQMVRRAGRLRRLPGALRPGLVPGRAEAQGGRRSQGPGRVLRAGRHPPVEEFTRWVLLANMVAWLRPTSP